MFVSLAANTASFTCELLFNNGENCSCFYAFSLGCLYSLTAFIPCGTMILQI